jgi:hypothetical protein
MAFVLKQSTSYKWPVSFKLPVDGGKYEKQTFEAEFRRLPQARLNEIQDAVQERTRAAKAGEPIDGMINDQAVADEILIGWSNVLDEDGDEIPFTTANKQQLLEVSALASSIIVAYFESVTGNKLKN